ncbi:hypothetical protein FT641_19280 [Bacillus paranthracis]|uniref:hypothetical protein n=1 Tax=Bacillus paranthracis TaxID=2026186 RepID=UPI00187AB4BA|nr:hypothetical protein [Bacillus paranthracis]MBE7114292.1 hypothetical protein [Bacillus paranthracis]MBE7154835.1 hypothetical protein [Bacillus paranthracis]
MSKGIEFKFSEETSLRLEMDRKYEYDSIDAEVNAVHVDFAEKFPKSWGDVVKESHIRRSPFISEVVDWDSYEKVVQFQNVGYMHVECRLITLRTRIKTFWVCNAYRVTKRSGYSSGVNKDKIDRNEKEDMYRKALEDIMKLGDDKPVSHAKQIARRVMQDVSSDLEEENKREPLLTMSIPNGRDAVKVDTAYKILAEKFPDVWGDVAFATPLYEVIRMYGNGTHRVKGYTKEVTLFSGLKVEVSILKFPGEWWCEVHESK